MSGNVSKSSLSGLILLVSAGPGPWRSSFLQVAEALRDKGFPASELRRESRVGSKYKIEGRDSISELPSCLGLRMTFQVAVPGRVGGLE